MVVQGNEYAEVCKTYSNALINKCCILITNLKVNLSNSNLRAFNQFEIFWKCNHFFLIDAEEVNLKISFELIVEHSKLVRVYFIAEWKDGNK